MKNWAWITTDLTLSIEDWKNEFATMRRAGIDAILPEVYNNHEAFYKSRHLPGVERWLEKLLPIAKAEGLEVHAWVHCMPCNIERIIREHPEWYTVNRNGDSSMDKPAYANHYKFLCPNRPGAQEFVCMTIKELARMDGLDGIHLDYIRYPDVILAKALQVKRGIVQDREYPEYDYCYCDVCRNQFQARTGLDPMDLEDPSAHKAWIQFRYNSISHLVDRILAPAIRKEGKQATAAVFPNWESVRQQWFKWNLDAALPMLYHSLYDEDLKWITEQTMNEIRSLSPQVPLYSGLFVPGLTPDDLPKAIEAALEGGAQGIALFSGNAMSQEHWIKCKEALSGK